MKEYIKLVSSSVGHWSIIGIVFFKDSKCKIYHRENGKPAQLWDGALFEYYENGSLTRIVNKDFKI